MNGHIFYVLFISKVKRVTLLQQTRERTLSSLSIFKSLFLSSCARFFSATTALYMVHEVMVAVPRNNHLNIFFFFGLLTAQFSLRLLPLSSPPPTPTLITVDVPLHTLFPALFSVFLTFATAVHIRTTNFFFSFNWNLCVISSR